MRAALLDDLCLFECLGEIQQMKREMPQVGREARVAAVQSKLCIGLALRVCHRLKSFDEVSAQEPCERMLKQHKHV